MDVAAAAAAAAAADDDGHQAAARDIRTGQHEEESGEVHAYMCCMFVIIFTYTVDSIDEI